MAYDEALAGRIRRLLDGHDVVTERKMFGGIAFMLNGNMICGVVKDELMVRVGAEAYADALARPHARPMDFTGRPMKGMLFVGAEGIRSDSGLSGWTELSLAFAGSLPPKK
jgi:TfoX/Sxy family transcriptional regulator of competence genes